MKIGLASVFYATPKGHSYVNANMVKALKDAGHEVHIYAIKHVPLLGEFPRPDTIELADGLDIPKEDFEKWLKEKQLDWCIFNEYNQWQKDKDDKVDLCKEHGVKTCGFLVWERLNTDVAEYKKYDKIVAPTGFQTKLMRKAGLFQTVHVKWGVDFEEIDAIPEPKRPQKLTFYHCAGSGGVDDRKNTEKIIQAYDKIRTPETDLMITHLQSRVFSRKEILSFMKYADVVINVSKWDTIGLNTLEANALGRPVMVCNAPPMNELVKDNINGILVDGEIGESPNVACPSIDVDVDLLAAKMNIFKNEMLNSMLKSNARKFAEINFDWKKNQKDFLKIFEVPNDK